MGDLFTYLTVPVRVLGLLVWRGPRLIWSGILFFIKGPRHPSWSFGLHMSVETLRQYLISNVSEAEWALKADQLISTVPEPIRSGCRLRKAYHIPFHPLALGFIREKMAGQLTKEALAQHHSTAEWIEPCDVSMHRQGTILMLHGGGFVMGSPQFHRWLSCALSKGTGMRVLGLAYRRAPQHPFPCALIDALSAYLHLLESHSPEHICLVGDSAGGGLVMSLLLALNEGAWRQPHRAVLLSPWIDLNLSLPSTDSNESTDYLVRGSVESYARLYVSKNEFRNSFVSPLFASDLSGLCPILIQIGSAERLCDEGMALHERLQYTAQAHTHKLQVYANMPHVFQLFGFLQESREALSSACGHLLG